MQSLLCGAGKRVCCQSLDPPVPKINATRRSFNALQICSRPQVITFYYDFPVPAALGEL
jgi:hypothetical protein